MLYKIYGPRASGPHKTLRLSRRGFCGAQKLSGHVFHTSRQAMIKTYITFAILTYLNEADDVLLVLLPGLSYHHQRHCHAS